MKTIQVTLDDDLVKALDRVSRQFHTSRSAFIRKALREALERHNPGKLEFKHRKGYELRPTTVDEFSVWENEQDWGDE